MITRSNVRWKSIPSTIRTSDNQKLAFAQYALQLEKVSTPKGHNYSNAGTIIAALMLERKSGKSWDVLIDELFNELEMDYHIGFPSQIVKNDSYGHQRKVLSFLSGKKYKVVQVEDEFEVMDYFSPAGNCSINIQYYSKFIQYHLKGLEGEDNFLKSTTFQFMHFGIDYYSMGWYNGKIGKTDQQFSYHGGSLGTYSSMVMLSADRNIAIIILVNADDKNVNEFKTKLREKIWDQFGTKKY